MSRGRVSGLGYAARVGALAIALGTVMVVLAASPASAHGVGGIQPTNYRTTVAPIVPAIAGLDLRSVDLGNGLELHNGTDRDVIVLGYDGEPYLRVGPRGVFQNTHSPATYLNKSAGTVPRSLPPTADANAAPAWHRISGSTTARWHDHRAHWMGTSEPPEVQKARGSTHVVQRFTIRLRTGGRNLSARGVVTWEPGPAPWPWIGLAVALVVGGIGISRLRRWARWTAIALAGLMVAEAVHIVGVWGATTQSQWSDLAQSAYSIAGIGLGVLALARLLRRGGYAGAPLTLCAGLFLGIAGGLADVTTLSHSQLPTTLPHWLTRLAVAAVLGLGGAVATIAALHLRAPPRSRERATVPDAGTAPAFPSDQVAAASVAGGADSSLRAALRERSHTTGRD